VNAFSKNKIKNRYYGKFVITIKLRKTTHSSYDDLPKKIINV